jgi:hypothetical protein
VSVELTALALPPLSFTLVVVGEVVVVVVVDVDVTTSLVVTDVDSAALLPPFELHPVTSTTADASTTTQIDECFMHNPLPKKCRYLL